MKSGDVISVLRLHQDHLRARGVLHAALFGSVARGDFGPDSDIDILVDVAPDLDLYRYASVKRYIAALFNEPVDVVSRAALKPHLRRLTEADVVNAF